MDTLQTISLAAALAWASGFRLYLVLFVVGLLGKLGYIALPQGLELLTHPWVIGASGFMAFVEFFADKLPGIDTLWDAVHTFIRIPAGALLAAGAVGPDDAALALAAAIIGGTLASGSHLTKAGSRALINTSPEPVSNWTASFSEDALVAAGLWAALAHPWLFLAGLAVFVLLVAWLLPKLWRGMKRIVLEARRVFSGARAGPAR